MSPLRVLLTTVDSEEKARELASSLVEARLAACVSVLPIQLSVYPWQGNIVREPEWLLLIKTAEPNVGAIRDHFRQHHPYQVPEFLVLHVAYAGPEYAAWLLDWVTGSAPGSNRDA